MEQGAEPVLQWDGVGGGPGCTGFRQLALHTCCRAQRPAAVSNRFLLAFSLRSLSQKIRIIVTAGSEWGKKKSGKEKSIKITFFPPLSGQVCRELEMKAQVCWLKYFRILYLEKAKTYLESNFTCY